MGNDLLAQIKQNVANQSAIGDAAKGKQAVENMGAKGSKTEATPAKGDGFLTESEIKLFQMTVDSEKENISKHSRFRKFILDSNSYKVPVYDSDKMKEFKARNVDAPNLRALTQQAQEAGQLGEPELKDRGGKKLIGVLFDRPKLKGWDGVDPATIEYELELMKSKDFMAFMTTKTKFILGGTFNDNNGIRIDIKRVMRKGVPKFANSLVVRDGVTKNTDPEVSMVGKIYATNPDGTRVVDQEKVSVNEDTGYKTYRYVFDWNPAEPLIKEVFGTTAGGKKAKKAVVGGTLAEHDLLQESELMLQEYIASQSYL